MAYRGLLLPNDGHVKILEAETKVIEETATSGILLTGYVFAQDGQSRDKTRRSTY